MATFSWTAAYVLSIALRQEAHKVFVFGHYEGVWYENLWRFYCVYFLTVATSMPVNMLLLRLMKYLPTQVLSLGITDATLAYFGTTIYTGLFSYLRLKANWRKPGSTVKLNRSVLDVSILPTSAGCKPLTKPGAFSKYQATPSEMRERGLMHLVTRARQTAAQSRGMGTRACRAGAANIQSSSPSEGAVPAGARRAPRPMAAARRLNCAETLSCPCALASAHRWRHPLLPLALLHKAAGSPDAAAEL
eukprot:CAMPEP_0179905024 /NCGR_PEP_ID=MMETSP0982-20121206/42328_1 /TAXON_ID=483367 /ORGANISM="non described non described, Strain CCMP 2436" /LENGTH=246 /DNA_ID=CAMNT_0021805113 /DNA_START=96 /DNA_END=837 /DNA_ORIENTATION=+